jgi:hypothetical protein
MYELEKTLNGNLRGYLTETLTRTIASNGHWRLWYWALHVPSLTDPQRDFEDRCALYWRDILELEAIDRAHKKAKKRSYSPTLGALFIWQGRQNFVYRYELPVQAIDRVHREKGLSEWDLILAAAWLKACIHLYPSVSKALQWHYREGENGWHASWLNDLPTVVVEALTASPSRFKNLAHLQKTHIRAARQEFRQTFKPQSAFPKKRSSALRKTATVELDVHASEPTVSALDAFIEEEKLNEWSRLLSPNEAEIFALLRSNPNLSSKQISTLLGRPAGQIRVEKKRLLDKIRKVTGQQCE